VITTLLINTDIARAIVSWWQFYEEN